MVNTVTVSDINMSSTYRAWSLVHSDPGTYNFNYYSYVKDILSTDNATL